MFFSSYVPLCYFLMSCWSKHSGLLRKVTAHHSKPWTDLFVGLFVRHVCYAACGLFVPSGPLLKHHVQQRHPDYLLREAMRRFVPATLHESVPCTSCHGELAPAPPGNPPTMLSGCPQFGIEFVDVLCTLYHVTIFSFTSPPTERALWGMQHPTDHAAARVGKPPPSGGMRGRAAAATGNEAAAGLEQFLDQLMGHGHF